MAAKRFKNRPQAGKLLARRLTVYAERPDVIILALPRGGVPVAASIANILNVPLDVMLVRKLGVPGNEELAMGAIASGGTPVTTPDVVQMFGLTTDVIEAAAARESREIARREVAYREGSAPPELKDRTVILVDDGLATGATMLAAARATRIEHPAHIVIAVPVGPPDTCSLLSAEADEIICLTTPHPFFAVGQWYEDFAQTTDEEVIQLLHEARQRRNDAATRAAAQPGNKNASGISHEGTEA